MRSLDDPQLLREIIMDHYDHPCNRGLVEDETYKKVNMNSDTCIDDLDIQVKFDGDKIADVRYDGEACAICTSSTSIMSELVIGKTKEEAKRIIENYMNMIYERDYDEDLLEEAIAFKNTHKQANRIKCATLGWNGLVKLIEESEE
ncbi:Fe-S cluster assembly sulfur transfer protein SufU [Coprobacillus cateniformis]|uniref:Fe-S cluster assembly sulfur transfer protein SufU n=1 Tax=Coprobacillus cateniformis TaxID=100884 RepID=UPI000E5290FA|nr:SUF system NifU family Fe-S cluster assembly protein [Coprobacillus cateniformis]RGY47950.1 SUF system NifU family Fe-S cluster assembly protein [Coprobacillus cateniformis]